MARFPEQRFTIICLSNLKSGCIAIQCGTTLLGEVETTTLCRAVLSGAESFLRRPENQLADDDPVLEDLTAAIEEFTRAFPS